MDTKDIIDMPFEHINPINFEEVIDGLRNELKKRDTVIEAAEIWSNNWGLRRHVADEIIVTNKDGSGVLLRNNDDTSIAESLFYRMMDEILTGKPKEPCKNCDKCKNPVYLEDAWEES